MHGGRREEDFSETADLDHAASEYAIAWMVSDTSHRYLLRDDLIRRLIPFADRLASRYRERTEPLDDIRQAARLGLVKAVDRYNPERGSFTAFAFVTINGEVKRHFRDRTWSVHVNRRLQDLSMEVGHATAELTQALSRTPTAPEIARHLKVDEHDVRNAHMCAAGRTPMSLNTQLGDDGRELGDLIGKSDSTLESVADRLALEELVRELPPEIQRMIIMRFHGNRTQSQIATEFGISQMHVSRLLRRGLAWLRTALLSDSPPSWHQVHEYLEPETMKVQLRKTDTSIDVRVGGDIDADTADRLSRRLQSAISLAVEQGQQGQQGRLGVDLTRVLNIDTTGAAVLRDARISASRSQVTMTIIGLPPHLESILAGDEPPTTTLMHP
ncbi:sigma-70 family RNA polymerase sigma factor [Actinoplanes sp. KI2]|uniref:sigma-70 family RNA polymerase sigma factor n=1 Tax=Actinoplanes sp. KI2 TaxID=2983315 RepID=UPI0021D60144|nr:sigma-70 family RNA polymerase sigma factor [Actinoplanes sp. KI2]MCU7727112.1 sigma-70 family RNA polymerase sigma factor [Actinoplanes sp. KI2]